MVCLKKEMVDNYSPVGFVCAKLVLDSNQEPLDYQLIKVNHKAEKLIGLNHDEIVGKNASELSSEFFASERPLLRHFAETARTGESRSVEHFFEHSRCWYKLKVYAIDRYTLHIYYQDITQYKLQIEAKEKQLENEIIKYKKHLKDMPFAVFLADENANIIETNIKATDITGYSQTELMDMNFLDFINENLHFTILRRFERLKKKGSWRSGMDFVTKSGEARVANISAVKMSDKRFLAMVEDITDRKRLQKRQQLAHDILFNVLKNMDLVVFISDAKTNEVLFVNEYCMQYYGSNTYSKCWQYKGETGVCAECMAKDGVKEHTRSKHFYNYDKKVIGTDKWMKWQVRSIKWIDGRDVHLHIATDITTLKETEEELSRREKTLQSILDLLPVGLCISDEKGNLLSGNPAAERIWGAVPKVGRTDYGVFKGRRLPSGEEICAEDWSLSRTIDEGRTIENEMIEIDAFDGEKRIILNSTSPVKDETGDILGAIIVNQEITELKRAEDSLLREKELMRITLQSIGEGVVVTDERGIITLVNERMCHISGFSQEEALGKAHHDVFITLDEKTRDACEDLVDKALRTNKRIAMSNHTVLVCKDGSERAIAQSAAPIVNEKRSTRGVVIVIRDVTEERAKKERILYLSYHDSLTGLYNRRYFEEELNRLNIKRNLPLSIVMGDVNGLKLTNDAFGHDRGDEVLKKMAETISNACRRDDIIARWGGDEFIMLLPKTSRERTEKLCRRISEKVKQVKMDGIEFSISFGYETKNHEDEDINTIMKTAEDVMYRRKSVDSPNMRGNTIKTILRTLHEKTPREEFHSNRVSKFCQSIGRALKLSDNEIYELGIIGLMHDIGKIAIRKETLNKNGKLTEEEWKEIRQHPEIGYRILSASNDMSYIADYVLAHHEWFDGSGYPNRIKGNKIPLQARILTVADAYDAMTSDRPYRSALPESVAIKELQEKAGIQFDKAVVKAFVKTRKKKGKNKKRG